MKQLVLIRSSARGLVPLPDGSVAVPRPPASRPHTSVRCVGCTHFQTVEFTLGSRRTSCDLGHLVGTTGALRWYSNHELEYPSRQLLDNSRRCTDREPAAATA